MLGKCRVSKTGPKPQTTQDRFVKFVEPEPMSGCWLWTGYLNKDGYGRFGMKNNTGVGHRWQAKEAHQVSYELFVGDAPKGGIGSEFVLDHVCNNRCCVNPSHLQLLTRVQNVTKGKK